MSLTFLHAIVKSDVLKHHYHLWIWFGV